ncbi:WD40-repeat-containing domain protein [Suillus americanus]|nr:WD40-repeat-containing domain protein [Suillus americanus]
MTSKRAKLAELRKARADRQQAETERQQTEPGPSSIARRDVDDLINHLIGSCSGLDTGGDITPSSSLPNTPPQPSTNLLHSSALSPSGRVSRQSDVGSNRDRVSMGTTMVGMMEHVDRVLMPRFIPDLIDECVIYNKEVQATAIEPEMPQVSEDGVRQQIMHEQELEVERIVQHKELEEESVQLEKEIEQEIREHMEKEHLHILSAPEFLDFVEQSSKILQCALNNGYDYIHDYNIGMEANGCCQYVHTYFWDDSEGKCVKRICAFYDEQYGKNYVASYNKNPAALNEPDGIVAVWNLHLLDRPEFVFHSQSDVLSITFSPFHSNLVFGGTYSGQILLWDTRSKHLPVLKTPLSAAGHTHLVYAMQMVGTQNAHNLITSSTDGTVCNNETTTFWVGTKEGNVYQANWYHCTGAKAGLNQYDIYKGHMGPVMGLHFHPLVGPVNFSDLFLTMSVDWMVKLWCAKLLAKPSTAAHAISPIYSFNEADDYVYIFDVWNLNMDMEVPVVFTNVRSGQAINKLQWDRKDGQQAALRGSDGKLYVYDIGDMALPRESEWMDLQKTIAGFVGGGQANGVADGIVAGR